MRVIIHRVFPVLLLCLVANLAFSQSIFLRNDFPVLNGTDTLSNAWAGGHTAPQFSTINLNADTFPDLFVFDRVDNTVTCYINESSPGNPKFRFDPSWSDTFPTDLYGWTLLRDYDGDGYKDIWTGSTSSRVKIYRNKKGDTGILEFEEVVDRVETNYPPALELYSGKIDIPAIDDIDYDGDLDILTFNILGGQMEWHKNVSVDSGYGRDSLIFVQQSACFGHFSESAISCTPILNQPPCGTGMRMEEWDEEDLLKTAAHAGSSTLSLDLNDDGLKDLLIGDVGCNTIYSLINGGTTSIAHFDTTFSNFPDYDVPIDIYIFPATFYEDIDRDGVKDLLVAPNIGTDINNHTGVWIYRNLGSNTLPDFEFVQEAFLQDDMFEFGAGTAPAFFDYDNDGLMDLLVGNSGIFLEPLQDTASLHLYLNVGSATNPVYQLHDRDFLGLATDTSIDANYLIPAFADLDGDDDDDLYLGTVDGNIIEFENVAGPGDTADFSLVTTSYFGFDVGDRAAPTFYDYDGDTDLDMFVGTKRGYIKYYDNFGTASLPLFTISDDTFGNIKINDRSGNPLSSGYSKPFFADVDEDTTVELLVGGVEGWVEIYEDVNPATDTFTFSGYLAEHDFGTYSTPYVIDLDSNDILDYIIGNQRGGLQHASGTFVVSTDPEFPDEKEIASLQAYPVPTSGELKIVYKGPPLMGESRIYLYNTLGQMVLRKSIYGSEHSLDLSDFERGIYILKWETQRESLVSKILISD